MKSFFLVFICFFIFVSCSKKNMDNLTEVKIIKKNIIKKESILYKYDDFEIKKVDSSIKTIISKEYKKANIKKILVLQRFYPGKVQLKLQNKDKIYNVVFIIPVMPYSYLSPEDIFKINKTVYFIEDKNNIAQKYLITK